MDKKEKHLKNFNLLRYLNYSLLPISIFVFWYVVTKTGEVPTVLLPTIGSVMESLGTQIKSGRLIQ